MADREEAPHASEFNTVRRPTGPIAPIERKRYFRRMSNLPDPLFRQRLRVHYADLKAQMDSLSPKSQERFDLERSMLATARLYSTLYRETLEPLHSGPHPETPKGPPPR